MNYALANFYYLRILGSTMVVHMRHTKGHTGNRRSHHALKEASFATCADCGAKHLMHRVCMQCGKYRGRVVVDVTKKAVKAAKKAEAKKPVAAAPEAKKEKAKKTEEKAEKKTTKK